MSDRIEITASVSDRVELEGRSRHRVEHSASVEQRVELAGVSRDRVEVEAVVPPLGWTPLDIEGLFGFWDGRVQDGVDGEQMEWAVASYGYDLEGANRTSTNDDPRWREGAEPPGSHWFFDPVDSDDDGKYYYRSDGTLGGEQDLAFRKRLQEPTTVITTMRPDMEAMAGTGFCPWAKAYSFNASQIRINVDADTGAAEMWMYEEGEDSAITLWTVYAPDGYVIDGEWHTYAQYWDHEKVEFWRDGELFFYEYHNSRLVDPDAPYTRTFPWTVGAARLGRWPMTGDIADHLIADGRMSEDDQMKYHNWSLA